MKSPLSTKPGGMTRRAAFGLAAGAASLALGAPSLRAASQRIRIGLATKTWWPSVVADVAVKQGLFAKAGLDPELTVYRSGGESFEAQAAGAADLITGLVSQIATGRTRGVNTKILALSASANTGWRLLVKTGSPIKDVKDIAGRKVGITTAGSLSDVMALWTRAQHGIDFTSVPLGGGGLVPNLLSGNVDAAVVYSPLSFQTLQARQTVSLLDYAAAMPSHLAVSWSAPDTLIGKQPEMLRAALAALYGAVVHLQKNRDEAVRIIAEANSVSEAVAAQEFEETFMKLSTDGRFTVAQVEAASDLARLGGFKNLAPPDQIYTTAFTPVVAA
ncbi:ABC transporter substrate-binding protein [Methylobacterium sp. EM32]|uniref:ABC transporter substrate-binding protein n=1 Tax=Methylobacterium sp. EM32 TaxID=3163481 RepID=UPI0033A1778D